MLALDGSTQVCGAALLELQSLSKGEASLRAGEDVWQVLARANEEDARGQARVLLRLVDDVVAQMGAAPDDLGAIVVGTGPGTFTGVRIAVATARAMGLALQRPVVGISSLAALAASAAALAVERSRSEREWPQVIVPVIDARRGQVFYGMYVLAASAGTEGTTDTHRLARWIRSLPFSVCERGTFGTVVARAAPKAEPLGNELRPLLVVAERAELIADLPQGASLLTTPVEPERLVWGQHLLDEPGEKPEGRRLTPWLRERLAQIRSGAEDVATRGAHEGGAACPGAPEAVRPIYVRAPDADVHITKMRDPWAAAGKEGGSRGGGRSL